MSNIEILEVQQNYQDENTTVWSEIDGESFGVCFEAQPTNDYSQESSNGFHVTILDCDGYPIALCNYRMMSDSFNKLIELAIEEIN